MRLLRWTYCASSWWRSDAIDISSLNVWHWSLNVLIIEVSFSATKFIRWLSFSGRRHIDLWAKELVHEPCWKRHCPKCDYSESFPQKKTSLQVLTSFVFKKDRNLCPLWLRLWLFDTVWLVIQCPQHLIRTSIRWRTGTINKLLASPHTGQTPGRAAATLLSSPCCLCCPATKCHQSNEAGDGCCQLACV